MVQLSPAPQCGKPSVLPEAHVPHQTHQHLLSPCAVNAGTLSVAVLNLSKAQFLPHFHIMTTASTRLNRVKYLIFDII